MRKHFWLIPVLGWSFVTFFAPGCHRATTPIGPQITPTSVNTATPIPTSTATTALTLTPTRTSTLTPVPSSTFTPTRTYTSTSTLTATYTATVPPNTPTSTATPTRTFTVTITSSPTNTWTPPLLTYTPSPTSTHTLTFTVTSTPTRTFTDTHTIVLPTPTITYTHTLPPVATLTFTPSPVNTSTFTVTPTTTIAICNAASVQSTYTFESGLDCWKLDTGSNAVVTSWGNFTGVSHTGTGSLGANVSQGTTPVNVQFQIQYSPAANLAGRSVSVWVMVDGSMAGCQAQVFQQSGAGWTFTGGAYTTLSVAGDWYALAWTPTFTDATQVQQIGVQFYNCPASAVGRAFVDDVTLWQPPTPTQTPNAIMTWTFESTPDPSIGTAINQPNTWYDNGTGTVTGVVGWATPGYNASLGCLNSLVTFTAQNQNEKITFTPPTTTWDWSATGLNVTGIRGYVWIDASLSNGFPGCQLTVESGPSYTWEQAAWAGLTKGGWTAVSFNPTWAGGDRAQVRHVWFQINTGGSGTVFGSGNVKIDNVELY